MKIYIVTQNFPPKLGGIQNVMFSIADDLSKLDHDVEVIPDHYCKSNLNFKITNFILPKIFRSTIKKLFLNLVLDNNHLVICDTWKSVRSVPMNFTNIVMFAHGQEYLNLKNKKRIFNNLLRVKFLIASSYYTLNLIKSNWDLTHLNSTVIYPTYHIKKKYEKLELKKNNKITSFFSICRIEKRKGLIESLNAFYQVKKKGYNFVWNIIGNGPELEMLQNLTLKLKLNKNIFFHGEIKNSNIKFQFLRNSDVFIMPSFQDKFSIEGFGLSYIEAAQFGVPSIGGIKGGSAEAVINNQSGWCVNPHNQNLLIDIIIESITNKILRQKLGNNALNRFNKELNGNIALENFLSFIKIKR